MPESPDFEQLARAALSASSWPPTLGAIHPGAAHLRDVAEQLRQVWNARGAADRAEIETISPFPTKVTLDALRRLDR